MATGKRIARKHDDPLEVKRSWRGRAIAKTPFTEADGRQLAVDMLRELGDQWISADLEQVPDDQITETLINIEPTIVRRYVESALASDHSVQRGFLCVLSEYIGSAVNGSQLDPEGYERYMESRHG